MVDKQEWNWQFFGFQWLNGNKPVQDWFDGLPDDAKDEARDTIGYLRYLPPHLWKRPRFDPLSGEDVTEVRFDTATNTYRIYGFFGGLDDKRQIYTFLYGADKKTRNDLKGKREASKLRRIVERKEATVHRFEFYRESDSEN
jgi:hypothetical protein